MLRPKYEWLLLWFRSGELLCFGPALLQWQLQSMLRQQ